MTAEYKQCGNMASRTPAMHGIFRNIMNYARRLDRIGLPIYICGETGTGKEEVAKALHLYSDRANEHFVPVNCGAIPTELVDSHFFGHARGAFTGAVKDVPGYFEQAKGGILFLDEINSLQPQHQARLLRVIQEGKGRRVGEISENLYSHQLISASNIPLEQAVEEGAFRKDLMYRLKVGVIELLPLRERMADILLLADHFLDEFSQKMREEYNFAPGAMSTLVSYHWPGNIRELRQVIGSIIMEKEEGDTEITLGEITDRLDRASARSNWIGKEITPIKDLERNEILRALLMTQGNVTAAAEALGISGRNLFRKIKTFRDEGYEIPFDKR